MSDPRRSALDIGVDSMPHTAQSRPWPDVVSFYRELVEEDDGGVGPLLGLVEFLAGSLYAAGLFPTTSMFKLCMGRTRILQWNHEMLTVEYDTAPRRFTFTFFEASQFPTPWVTGCDASSGRAHLERILTKRLRWFKESSPASEG